MNIRQIKQAAAIKIASAIRRSAASGGSITGMLCNTKTVRFLNNTLKLSCAYSTSAEPSQHLDNFEHDFHTNHIPTNALQRIVLSVGSAAMSLLDPHRGDMIACLGETTGHQAAQYVMNKMLSSAEGADILKQRPRINSQTVDLEKLKMLPEGTLGKVYSNFLEHNKVTPDSRLMVQFVDDVNIAYVIQRYREVHDLIHTILEMPTNMLGEVTVKWVEAIQTRFPMCIGGALFGPIRLQPKQRQLYKEYYLPWALQTGTHSDFLLNIFFERRWEQPLSELHKELGITSLVLPPKKLF